MRLAWRELVRRPGRFLTAGLALTLLVVLLLVLGGILDALIGSSTGLLRAQSAPLIAYAADSRDSIVRSRIDAATLDAIREVPGIHEVSGLGIALLPARVPGAEDLADVAVYGYEAANRQVPPPPAPGEAHADRVLQDEGLAIGDTLELGSARVPVEVVGWVEDTSYSLQAGVWVEPATWRTALNENVPNAAVADGVFQAALITPEEGLEPATAAARVDDAVPAVRARTIEDAIAALPGVAQQESVFGAIIAVTFVVAGLVVALFFALITIERVGLLGVLKAIGASSRNLAAGLTLQAVLIAGGALVVGGLLTLGLAAVIPDTVPLQLGGGRFAFTAVGLVTTALIGSALSFRRIVRIDPASAVGGA
ncbi:MAG TPA: ABC transporter permease [Actinomycetota bacterium]